MNTAEELDGFMVTREVEETVAFGRRWISEKIKNNEFPPPDVPGRRGSAHRWRRSTIRKYLDSLTLPTQAG